LKLIAVLRNPVERAVSAYFHYMATGLLPIVAAEEGLTRLLAGEEDPRFPRGAEVLRFGLYARNLEQFDACFAADRWHILLLEDVRKDPSGALRGLYSFVGVRDDYLPRSVESRPMQAPYSMARLRWRQRLYAPVRRRGKCERYLAVRQGVLAALWRGVARGIDAWVLGRVFPAAPPELPAALVERLRDYYAADVAALERRLMRPLAHWLSGEEQTSELTA
jgi:hypothetical protein